MNDGRIIPAWISTEVLGNLAWYLTNRICFPMVVQEGVSLAGENDAKITDIHILEYRAPS